MLEMLNMSAKKVKSMTETKTMKKIQYVPLTEIKANPRTLNSSSKPNRENELHRHRRSLRSLSVNSRAATPFALRGTQRPPATPEKAASTANQIKAGITFCV